MSHEYKGTTMRRRSLLKAILAVAAASAVQMPSQVDADIASGYLDVVNTYRHDKISAHINTYNYEKVSVGSASINLKDISLYQLGVKGQLVACNLFTRGEAYWGWSDNGSYRENSTIWNGSQYGSKARLHKGETRDFTVGAGYYLPSCGILNIGPSGGWSYQSQQFTVHRARYLDYPDDLLNGLQFKNVWQGPWAGVDAQMDLCGFDLRAGYSYHWATWEGKWHQKAKGYDWQGDENLGFSEKCKTSDARGQVAYLDLMWGLCPCVELGLGFKWQRWEAKNAKQRHGKPDHCEEEYDWRDSDKVKTDWESYAVSINVGVSF